MTGTVDGSGRALLPLRVKATSASPPMDLSVWVDTGFTADLVMPAASIAALGLPIGAAVEAVLAEGSLTQLDTYMCFVEWFGEWKQIEVVANQGQFPLLGVGLLLNHNLNVDYQAKTVMVD